MNIHLMPENASSLGEDTFWTWAEREFPAVMGPPTSEEDITLVYSTVTPPTVGKTIACCWELYPEMKRCLGSNEWDKKIEATYRCAEKCDVITVSTQLMVEYYKHIGPVTVLPIGVDAEEMFRPIDDKGKLALRQTLGFPLNAKIVFWCGTPHPMKGYKLVLEVAKQAPELLWLIVWKNKGMIGQQPLPENHKEFGGVPQHILADLMRCSNFLSVAGLLRPYFLVEWEAMASNVWPLGPLWEKDFIPGLSPREDVIRMGWDRKSAKPNWLRFIKSVLNA